MILRPVLASPLVWSCTVDPSATFEAGQIAGLMEINGELFATVSDGVKYPPIGIVDDNKTKAFTGTVQDEVSIVHSAVYTDGQGRLLSSVEVMGGLNETNIISSTFKSNIDVLLNPKKGVFLIPKDSPVNYDDGQIVGFEVISSYRFAIVDYPGDDSTDGSGKISIHFNRGIFTTNIFDTLATYFPGAPLYVDAEGKLTSHETASPMVAIALQPASAINNELLFMWL
jgi:hypothetical protein